MLTESPTPARDWETDDLLRRLCRGGWTLYLFGPKNSPPHTIAAMRQGSSWADVVILRGHDRAVAYRAVLYPGVDPLEPGQVLWDYQGCATHALRIAVSAAITDAGTLPYPAPVGCRVPTAQRTPCVVRPPMGS